MTDEERLEIAQRLEALGHAMQSGVAMDHTHDSRDGEPKHLRVGVNTALVETSALGKLLMNKGVITEDEYYASLVVGMEAEVERYEKLLSERYNRTITLA